MGHSGTNRIVLCHFLGIAVSEYRRKLAQQPACLSCLVFEPDGNVRVTLLNDTSHWANQA
jgi:broad specificity phosphatase PhoE